MFLPPGTSYLTSEKFNAHTIGQAVMKSRELQSKALPPELLDTIAKVYVEIAEELGQTVPKPVHLRTMKPRNLRALCLR